MDCTAGWIAIVYVWGYVIPRERVVPVRQRQGVVVLLGCMSDATRVLIATRLSGSCYDTSAVRID